jgi:histidine triad (HIT) family protein
MAEPCIFCKIAHAEVHAQTVMNSKDIMAFRDLDPQAPTHILIIPKNHIPSLDDVNDAKLLGEMFAMAAAIARQEGIAKTGYRIVVNTGKQGGQSVPHMHLHLLGGRDMTWPPG